MSALSYRRQAIPHRTEGGQTVIINAAHREVHVLNGTGSLIWALLGDWRTIDEVVTALAHRGGFDVEQPQVTSDVAQFLDRLVDKGLVTGAMPPPPAPAR